MYHSPIGTSYRSRTAAWQACGLEVTSKRKAEVAVSDTAAKLPAELTQKPQAQVNAVFARQAKPDGAQAPADSDWDDIPAEHIQSKPAQNRMDSHEKAVPAKRSRPATKVDPYRNARV